MTRRRADQEGLFGKRLLCWEGLLWTWVCTDFLFPELAKESLEVTISLEKTKEVLPGRSGRESGREEGEEKGEEGGGRKKTERDNEKILRRKQLFWRSLTHS